MAEKETADPKNEGIGNIPDSNDLLPAIDAKFNGSIINAYILLKHRPETRNDYRIRSLQVTAWGTMIIQIAALAILCIVYAKSKDVYDDFTSVGWWTNYTDLEFYPLGFLVFPFLVIVLFADLAEFKTALVDLCMMRQIMPQTQESENDNFREVYCLKCTEILFDWLASFIFMTQVVIHATGVFANLPDLGQRSSADWDVILGLIMRLVAYLFIMQLDERVFKSFDSSLRIICAKHQVDFEEVFKGWYKAGDIGPFGSFTYCNCFVLIYALVVTLSFTGPGWLEGLIVLILAFFMFFGPCIYYGYRGTRTNK